MSKQTLGRPPTLALKHLDSFIGEYTRGHAGSVADRDAMLGFEDGTQLGRQLYDALRYLQLIDAEGAWDDARLARLADGEGWDELFADRFPSIVTELERGAESELLSNADLDAWCAAREVPESRVASARAFVRALGSRAGYNMSRIRPVEKIPSVGEDAAGVSLAEAIARRRLDLSDRFKQLAVGDDPGSPETEKRELYLRIAAEQLDRAQDLLGS